MLRCVEYARRVRHPGARPQLLLTAPRHDRGRLDGGPHRWNRRSSPASRTTAAKARSPSTASPTGPGEAAQIFRVLADAEINIDMIVQNVSAEASKLADISFTLPKSDGPTAIAALEKVKHTVGYTDVRFDQHIGKVSLVGAGMRSHPGVSAKFFGALADAGVNLELISTSEIRISVVCRDTDVDIAVRAVHDAFDLGSDVEAVVYGGTGR